MYYEKVGLAYGASSGREITPDYPNAGVDIQPKIDEFRIVGPLRVVQSAFQASKQVMV